MSVMSEQESFMQLIGSLSGQHNVLTINRLYIGFTGTFERAIVLSQLV